MREAEQIESGKCRDMFVTEVRSVVAGVGAWEKESYRLVEVMAVPTSWLLSLLKYILCMCHLARISEATQSVGEKRRGP